jgi:hypothetical protein
VERQFKFSTTFHLSTYTLGQRKKGRGGRWKNEVESSLYKRAFFPPFHLPSLPHFSTPILSDVQLPGFKFSTTFHLRQRRGL